MNIKLKLWLLSSCLFTGIITTSLAQTADIEKIEIPLSQPGKTGVLRVNILHGSIRVSGHNSNQVVVSYNSKGDRQSARRDESEGLRRLPNNSTGLEVREENNNVTIKTSVMSRPADLEIKVPANFSVKLKTLNNGIISVEDLNGEFELDNLNGNIALRNVSGSVSATTLNGNIIAAFRQIAPNMPMAFSSLNGKIDVTFPANARFNAKMKTDNGDVYTDFDINVEDQKAITDSDKKGVLSPSKWRNGEPEPDTRSHRIYLDKWTYGKVNGGGPEILFKNFNGNIYIRKSK